jgi:hypothetical protein
LHCHKIADKNTTFVFYCANFDAKQPSSDNMQCLYQQTHTVTEGHFGKQNISKMTHVDG